MKLYKSVIKKLEEINYKKGVNRLDVNSDYYRVGKTLYYFAFAWFMFFQLSYIFSNTMALLFFERAGKNVDDPLYITFICAAVFVIAGLVFIKLKWHLSAFVLTAVPCAAEIIQLGKNEDVSLAFLEHGFLSNKYFWFHYAPAGLLILLALIVCGIGVKSYIHFRNDYKIAMASLYAAYSVEHPEISDIEWQKHLEEEDKALTAAEKGRKKK
ncbi:MAG: hypothetical protein UIG59_04040 [Acutalibacteraceae bacterium]|nr:hypothetical protein [Acutalibacteraceae bacterium]